MTALIVNAMKMQRSTCGAQLHTILITSSIPETTGTHRLVSVVTAPSIDLFADNSQVLSSVLIYQQVVVPVLPFWEDVPLLTVADKVCFKGSRGRGLILVEDVGGV